MSDVRLYPLNKIAALSDDSDKAILVVTEGTGSASDATEIAEAIGSATTAASIAAAIDAGTNYESAEIAHLVSNGGDYINAQRHSTAKMANSKGTLRVARMGDSLTENGGFYQGPNMATLGSFGRGTTTTAGSAPTNNATYEHWLFGGSLNGNSKQILAGSTVELSCGNSTATPIRGDRYSFYYLTVPGSGTFDLQYQANNTGSWVNIQTGINADGVLAGQVISGIFPTSGNPSYKLRVTNVTGAGFAFIGAGIYEQHGTGIVWLNDMLANGGVDLPSPLTTTAAVYEPIIRDLCPDLILSCWADATTEWQVGGAFQTLMDRINAATVLTVASVSTTNGSRNITYPSNFQVKPGQRITGSGIPNGTYIESVTSATAAVLSANATATASVTATLRPDTDWVQVSAHPLTVASTAAEIAGLAHQRDWAVRNKQTFIDMHAAFHHDAQWMSDMGYKSSADDAHLTISGGAVRWHILWHKLPIGRVPLGAIGGTSYTRPSQLNYFGTAINSFTEGLYFNALVSIGGATGGVQLLNRNDQFNRLTAGFFYSVDGEFWANQNNTNFAVSGSSSLLGWHPAANNSMLGGRGNLRWRIGGTGIQLGYRATTTDATFATDDHTIEVTSGSPNITLPAATATNASTSFVHNVAAGIGGKIFILANTGAGTPTIIGTVSGSVNPVVAAQTTWIMQSTGSAWKLLAKITNAP